MFVSRALLICIILMAVTAIHAQLPSSTRISLLTVAHGEDAYNIFGHTAIRVYDNTRGMDEVYNYGTFDYSTDNFLLKFLRGKLEYQLAIQANDRFLNVYHHEGRAIKEQVLDLDEVSKNKIYDFLKTNYLPENRLYLYDFFFDNCSTRVRDIFETELAGFTITSDSNAKKRTYRQLLDEYLQGLDWTDFGIDIIIGSIADADADQRAQSFLPDYLHDWADRVSYQKDGQPSPLVKSENQVLALDLKTHSSFWITPFRLFGFLAFIELLLFLFKQKAKSYASVIRWYDILGYLAISVTSIVVVFMWFLTDHQACGDNYNLLWANPLFIIVCIGQLMNKRSIKALVLTSLFLVITLLLWTIIPQQYHVAFIPIIVLFLFKNLRQIADLRAKLQWV